MKFEHLHGVVKMDERAVASIKDLTFETKDELVPNHLCRLAVERAWGSISQQIVQRHINIDLKRQEAAHRKRGFVRRHTQPAVESNRG